MTDQKRVPLAPEDRARVQRLTEEVKSRLYEVGLIMGRTVGHDVPAGTLVKYEARQSAERADQTIDVVIIALPDGTFLLHAGSARRMRLPLLTVRARPRADPRPVDPFEWVRSGCR